MKVLTNIKTLYRVPADGAHDQVDAVTDAAVAWQDGKIAFAGPAVDLPDQYAGAERFDAGGRCVVPGLIDSHTNLCFGGWRGDQFAARLDGDTYQKIQAASRRIQTTGKGTSEATTESQQA